MRPHLFEIIRVTLYIICCLASAYILFFWKRKPSMPITTLDIILPPIIIILSTFLMGIIYRFANNGDYLIGKQIHSLGKSLIVIAIVFGVIIFARKIIPVMMNMVLNFHQTNNQANLHRNPVKFFMEHADKIQDIFYFGAMLIASLAMFYGAIWGQDK